MQRLALLGVLALALGAAGCGGGGGSKTENASGSANTVTISETEFKLSPARVNIASTGSVTFEAKNTGQVDHALEVEGNGVEEKTGTISPRSSDKLTVDLSKAGTYEVYCPIDGHRGMGMEATVVVGSGGAGGGGTTTNESTSTKSGGYGY